MAWWPSILGPRLSFEGGLFLPEHKSRTARRPIETVPIRGPLHVPLQAMRDLPTTPVVAAGQRVLRGEILAEAVGPDSVSVNAPTSGRILRLEPVWTPQDGQVPGAVLEPDGQNASVSVSLGWDGESFVRQLADNGVVCPNPRMAAHALLRRAIASGVTDVIVNGLETEPYLTTDLRLLVEEPGRLVDAACEIADALDATRLIFAIPYRHRRVVRRLMSTAAGRYLEVVPLANKYPQCDAVVLVKTLLDMEVLPGGSVMDVGAIVLPLTLVRSVAIALLDGRPVTDAVITIAGEGVERPGTYRVAVGTPLSRLIEHVGSSGVIGTMVWGGPLTGSAIDRPDAVVTADGRALLLFRRAGKAQPVPCIHCGWCIEECPIGLDPPSLMELNSQNRCDGSELSQLKACVDCGLCSYVCPSELPLAASIRTSRARFSEAASHSKERNKDEA